MHVIKANISGNPNVGLFGHATSQVVIMGEKLRTKQRQLFEEVLGMPIITCRIAGTNLPGVFLASNSTTTLVPGIAFPAERVRLEKHIPITPFPTKVTCLGNAIACNDHGAIVSTEFSATEVAFIKKALGVPVTQMDVAGLTTPGAVIVTNRGYAVVHKDASSAEVKQIEQRLNVTCVPATVNLGSPYLLSGVLRSDHGFIVGDLSGGPEIVHLDEALGYFVVEDA